MKPYFYLPLLGEFHTNTVLMVLSLLLSLVVIWRSCLGFLSLGKILVMTIVASWLGFVGARLFHVFFERPNYFKAHPELIFAQFDGMTFYGAFFVGALVIFLFTKIYRLSQNQKEILWDASALCLSLTYFLMRLGCFANGCCWGKISSSIFAVQYYDPRAVMPIMGIPVHPVQIYDAAFGLFLVLLFGILRKERLMTGLHGAILCVLYPIGRFSTEFFRGDSFRGEDILFGLSTSQLISVVLCVFGVWILSRKKRQGP